MRLDIREPKRRVTKTEFDRWFNHGRTIISRPDKACKLRSRFVKFNRILHKNALYGRDRGL